MNTFTDYHPISGEVLVLINTPRPVFHGPYSKTGAPQLAIDRHFTH
jgi:hypothetical protein